MAASVRSPDDFIARLGLRNDHFQGIALTDLIRRAHHFACEVWINPELRDFADHGMNHSFEDLTKALELLQFIEAGPKEDRLTDLERTALCVGALVHDVGMQWNKYNRSNPLPDGDVRKHHVKNGALMFLAAMRPGESSGLGGFPELKEHGTAAHLLHVGGRVGFAHSTDDAWNAVVQDQRWNVGVSDQVLRPKMLAAAFRLADEIDNASGRLQNLDRLFADGGLADLTAAHWAACYYIHDVKVYTGRAGIQVELITRVPSGATDEDKRILQVLIEELRVRRIDEERRRIQPFLRPVEQIIGAQIGIRIDGPLELPDDQPTDAVKRWVLEHLLGSASGGKRDSGAQPNLREVAQLNDQLKVAAASLSERNEHGQAYDSIHVALRTGWHSNRYYWTERLLPGSRDVAKLVKGLAALYKDEAFTDILAIGTSGVRIASQLALVLGARCHFTFPESVAVDKRTGRVRYLDYERRYELSGSHSRVLVVDDILGVGAALQETFSELKALASPPVHLRAFCLLSLGRERPKGLNSLIPIDFLLADPAVKYWTEDTNWLCETCRASPSIVVRED